MNPIQTATHNSSKNRLNPFALTIVTVVLFASGFSHQDIEGSVEEPVASVNIKEVLANS